MLNVLQQEKRLRMIRRLTGIDNEIFNLCYQPAIDNFIEAAQLQPASTVDHHSSMGGLAVHTLEVVERALKIRKQFLLPQNSPTERILEEEATWTYTVFAGALLHDAGKLLTLSRCVDQQGKQRNPFNTTVETSDTYTVQFLNSSYELQNKASILLFGLLPPIGQQMITENEQAYRELLGTLVNDEFEWGVVGSIVKEADMASTGANLRAGGNRTNLVNTGQAPLAEKIITAIRSLIQSNDITMNVDGGMLWVNDKYAYLVSKRGAETVIEFLRDSGYSGIPVNSLRIYDELQRVGFLIPNSQGKAIWRCQFEGEHINHMLTVLKFRKETIIHESVMPEPFEGEITELSDPVNKDEEAAEASDSSNSEKNQNSSDGEDDAKTPLSNDAISKPLDTSDGENEIGTPEKDSDTKKKKPRGRNKINHPVKDIRGGVQFIEWMRRQIAEDQFGVNKKDAVLHIVEEGALTVSPRIFREYLHASGLVSESTDDDVKDQRIAQLQKTVRRLKAIKTSAGRHSVVSAKTVGSSSVINGFLWPIETLYEEADKAPSVNTAIEFTSDLDTKRKTRSWKEIQQQIEELAEAEERGRAKSNKTSESASAIA